MPARKSNVSTASAVDDSPARESMSVEDLSLPRTMVQRLAKGVLPPNTQIQKDALLAMSKSATVFVNYLSSHANEKAQSASKKTIQPKDIFDAIQELEFPDFIPRLEAELARYNAVQCDKRNTYRRKVREEKAAAAAAILSQQGITPGDANSASKPAPGANLDSSMLAPDMSMISNGTSRHGNDGDEPASKKMRRSDEEGIDDTFDDDGDEDGEAGEGEGEGEEAQDDEEVEDDVQSEDDEEGEEQLAEDPLEERREGLEEDEESGEESD
ncbi:histone-fold-containing protein [Patellaria atrata CBS 101060]|uniref:DNA polymerase epsilon subunit D n=1 Tax=Patellaria atrata CBS 101060 TaxID=1346257 RepID=A0A9P4VUY7_9PEZI|nr:histone-fold-containing protein [Patellaria atrata CBS 101060]